MQCAHLEDLGESKCMILKWMFCSSVKGILVRLMSCPTLWVCEDVLNRRVSDVGVAVFELGNSNALCTQ